LMVSEGDNAWGTPGTTKDDVCMRAAALVGSHAGTCSAGRGQRPCAYERESEKDLQLRRRPKGARERWTPPPEGGRPPTNHVRD
jgi:hypothetical protein